MIFYLLDCCTQVKNKATLVLLCIGKIFNFLFSNQIVESCTIFLIYQGLTSQKNTITRNYIKFIQNNNITRYKFLRTDSFEPRVLIIDKYVLFIFHIICLFFIHFHSHLQFLLNLLNSIKIIFYYLTLMLIYLRMILTQLHLWMFIFILLCHFLFTLIYQYLCLNIKIRFICQFLLIFLNDSSIPPVTIQRVKK